jgi:hypothetical protein
MQLPKDFVELLALFGAKKIRALFMTSLKAVEFEHAWEGRAEDSIGDVKLCILGIPELIRNKRAVGRPQDQADVAVLESYHKPKP